MAPDDALAGNRLRTLASIALLACSGCATHYEAGGAAPTARVIFSSDAPRTDGVMVQAFADRNCGRSPDGTRVVYFYRDLFDDRAGTARSVVAGREFVFTFRSRSDTGTVATVCRLTRAFVPQPSGTYRVHFVPAPDRCDVDVTELAPGTPDHGPGTRVDVAIVEPVCFNDLNG